VLPLLVLVPKLLILPPQAEQLEQLHRLHQLQVPQQAITEHQLLLQLKLVGLLDILYIEVMQAVF
jgi:hypothetical protein